MKKITFSAILITSIAAVMTLAIVSSPLATADTFYCSGSQTFSAFNNIVVTEGQTCVLGQFNVVEGNIQVEKGATLIVCADNDIAGNIEANGAKLVELIDYLTITCAETMAKGGNQDNAFRHGNVSFVNKAGTVGHLTSSPSYGDNGFFVFRIPGDQALQSCSVPVVGQFSIWTVSPPNSHKASGVTAGCNKALGLVVLGDINIQNTESFKLIGNTNGISIVRGDVSVQNTQTVEITNVAGVANTGFGIGGNLEISTSVDCIVRGNTIAGSTILDGCSNLAN